MGFECLRQEHIFIFSLSAKTSNAEKQHKTIDHFLLVPLTYKTYRNYLPPTFLKLRNHCHEHDTSSAELKTPPILKIHSDKLRTPIQTNPCIWLYLKSFSNLPPQPHTFHNDPSNPLDQSNRNTIYHHIQKNLLESTELFQNTKKKFWKSSIFLGNLGTFVGSSI